MADSPFEYAPAPESRDIARLRPSYQIFVDGKFRDGHGDAVKTINPADETPLAEVAEAGPSDVSDAVTAARRAFKQWSGLPGRERGKYLFRIARAIQERSRELAVLESLDNGKPIRESRDVDIPLAAAHFFYYAGWADKLQYAGFGAAPRPIGVAGQIIPWNFPLLMAAWKIAPALACGNTVVLKPAETTPLTALVLAEIVAEADLPPGVVNVLAGGPAIGQAIVEHAGIDKIAFTGSTEGRQDHPAIGGRIRQTGDPGTGRQGRQHRLRRRPDRPGRRGHRQRHLLQPGPGLLRRLAAAGPGVGRRRGHGDAAAPAGHPAGR